VAHDIFLLVKAMSAEIVLLAAAFSREAAPAKAGSVAAPPTAEGGRAVPSRPAAAGRGVRCHGLGRRLGSLRAHAPRWLAPCPASPRRGRNARARSPVPTPGPTTPARAVAFGAGFPRVDARARLVPTAVAPPFELRCDA
jgi:hypothetical protein